jgi:hypothetical protein
MCSNCKKGKIINKADCVLCPFKGIVTYDYHCKKFEFDIFKMQPRRKRKLNLEDYSNEDFSIS